MGSVAFWLKVTPPISERLSSALRAAAKANPDLAALLTEAAGDRENVLSTAREVSAYRAWLEFMERFSQEQRQHVAMLLAHDWKIVALGMKSPHNGEVAMITGEAK